MLIIIKIKFYTETMECNKKIDIILIFNYQFVIGDVRLFVRYSSEPTLGLTQKHVEKESEELLEEHRKHKSENKCAPEWNDYEPQY